MAYIRTVDFNEHTPDTLQVIPYGKNWPVVYIIDNGTEAYVGETIDASVRASQHWQNDERKKLTEISIISDDTFNKSVILDLESFLIKHMSADRKFRLQNGNAGLQLHNYFNRDIYQKRFLEIWDQLRQKGLADDQTEKIENSDIFKYSPYNALSSDQFAAVENIIHDLAEAIKNKKPYTAVVQGGPGTGKTILAIYLMKLLADKNPEILGSDQETDLQTAKLMETLRMFPSEFRIGLVIPMQSLRATITNVFRSVGGLKANMIYSPDSIASAPDFDLLIVDEAHRLKQRTGLAKYNIFDKNCEQLGFEKTATQLDWIRKKSRFQILFYDRMQEVLPQDIDAENYDNLLKETSTKTYHLRTQFRCSAGEEYIRYIQEIMSMNAPGKYKDFSPYELKLFVHVEDMINEIKARDKQFGLCRVVAGFAWDWVSKNDKTKYDIEIENKWYRWNTEAVDWVNSDNALDEIGCIHTVQGYDLNYVGVIIGREIDYDWENNQIVINKKYYKQPHGKDCTKDNPELLREYICNIYRTLMTRGIRGTYVYAFNQGMRKYLQQYISR